LIIDNKTTVTAKRLQRPPRSAWAPTERKKAAQELHERYFKQQKARKAQKYFTIP